MWANLPHVRTVRKQLFQNGSLNVLRPKYYTRPSIAPRPIIDIKHIRQNPGLHSQNCSERNYEGSKDHAWKILELFNQWQTCQRQARALREESNKLQRQLALTGSRRGETSSNSTPPADKTAILAEAKNLKEKLSVIDSEEKQLQDQIDDLAWELPNLTSTFTPSGDVPETVSYINERRSTAGLGKSHVDIGTELGILDFAAAATTSGWGWYYLLNEGAMLEHALVQYALSVARKRGWMVVSPPSIVYSHIAAACGFQPRDQSNEQQIYAIEQPEKDEGKPTLSLAGTAEIPLAGMKASQTFSDSELPLKMIGVNRCYRAEAGARGVDTKGLYRVHEFTKVEMFAWTLPDNSSGEHFGEAKPQASQLMFDEMLSIQTEILESLGLHCRVLEMPSTDLGASATRKRDIEAFFPSRREKDEGWGEVSSLSNCTDYQSRRLHTRIRMEKEGRRLDFPYTLNGTALAVPRVLACILENGWNQEQGTVTIPEVLRPWMDGAEHIQRRNVAETS